MKKINFAICLLLPILFYSTPIQSQSMEQTLNSAVANYLIGNYDEAIALYSEVIKKCDVYDASAYYGRGLAYDKLEEFDLAIKNYTYAVSSNPDYWRAYFNRGCVYYDLKNYKQAIQDFSKAIELNPRDSDAYLIRGSAKLKLGKIKDGYRDIKKSYKLKA